MRLRWKSNGKNAPKATEILVKVTSPGRHLGGKQTLYASKFIFGKDPAIVTVRPHANEQTIEELTWGRRVHEDEIYSKTELRDNQNGKCATE